jgi:arginine-tRNA-protein transferase
MINEYTIQDHLSPEQMDAAWANGWRHFGSYFFRYSRTGIEQEAHQVMPLRIQLDHFFLSKSQKRIVSKNRDLQISVRDAFLDQHKFSLFDRHKKRFTENIPNHLTNFTGDTPATVPCDTKEICLFKKNRLIAVSFWDIGRTSTSSIYAMFEPDESKRSLGIYLILLSIQLSIQYGKIFYYPGYAYRESSFYDYKKKFSALYYYNWSGAWLPLETT